MQGSAIGPASYVVNASDSHAVTVLTVVTNSVNANDTYIIIPADNFDSPSAELRNITNWARINNLKLNLATSQEIIFDDKRRKANSWCHSH